MTKYKPPKIFNEYHPEKPRITIVFTPEEHRLVSMIAKELDKSLSEVAHILVMQAIDIRDLYFKK